MNRDHYEYCKNELIQDKEMPYMFNNKELAKEFYNIFKQEVPTAKYYEVEEIGQFITYDQMAENSLRQKIDYRIEKHKKAMSKLNEALKLLEDSLKDL